MLIAVNLKAIDLNLLLALDRLLATGSVTRASAELGITQPAMSNALRRLRDIVADPIFLKQGRTLVPTAWAAAVRPALARPLGDLEAALATNREFDSRAADATITIAISDYWQFTLLPRLLARLERDAPRVRLYVMATSESVLTNELPRGTVSAAIYLSPRTFQGLHCETFMTDGYACIVRRGHPIKGRTARLEDLARFRHVVVAPRGPWSARLSEVLHRRKLDADIALLTAHNHVALDVVSRTNYIAIVPRQIARQAQRSWPLRVLAPPIPLGDFSLGLFWHTGTDASPLHRWFRAVMIGEAREAYLGITRGPRYASETSVTPTRGIRP